MPYTPSITANCWPSRSSLQPCPALGPVPWSSLPLCLALGLAPTLRRPLLALFSWSPALLCPFVAPAAAAAAASRPISGPVPPCPAFGLAPSLLLSFCSPSLLFLCGHFVVPPPPSRPFQARAAAADVNPRTRLSHMVPFIVCYWCTREQCPLMMQKCQNSLLVIPRILRRAPEFPGFFPGFSEKSDHEAQGSSTHTTPTHNPTPTQPLLHAASTEAPMLDLLKPAPVPRYVITLVAATGALDSGALQPFGCLFLS
jgi:hypothetical protein